MSTAYVDTSAIVSVAFVEAGADDIVRRLRRFRDLISSNLLEAELRSACAREGKPFPENLVSGFRWIHPNPPLSREMRAALRAGYLRGADLWHVACALYVARNPSDVSFITLDERQAEVAAALKFRLG
ncbi:PIN domain-containing protein [Candidatus Palauibacter sp.]|uniref:PIN domain-containing protein n=1 Tax=Candidatus Palauibacter sp. TaxID=3101350 RepID=UPI003CC5A09F